MLKEKESLPLGQADHQVLEEVLNKQTEIQLPLCKGNKVKGEYLKITGFSEAAVIYDNWGSNLKYTGALWYFIQWKH